MNILNKNFLLNFFFINIFDTNFFKSGFYLDYIIKKITEIFLKNFLIKSSLFFGEKFIIEFLTKKSIDNSILFFNKPHVFFLNFNFFFFISSFIFLIFLIFFNFFFFLLNVLFPLIENIKTLNLNIFFINFYGFFWNSIDYIYCTFSSFFFYNFYINLFLNNLIFNNIDLNQLFSFLIFFNLSKNFIFELFFSNLLDILIKNNLFFNSNFENFTKITMSFLNSNLFVILHPEIIFINKNVTDELLLDSNLKFDLILYNFVSNFSYISYINYSFQLFCIFFLIIFFCSFFCSFFSKEKNEFQLELEYIFSNISGEAEKELFSIDDAVSGVFFLVLMFGCYFGFIFLSLDISFIDISLFFLPLLFIFFFIILVPFNLLFDFGLFFIVYLRGGSNTSSLFFECIYDYIGIIAFFTRLIVQFVRIILMFVVYCMMHDTIMLQNYNQKNFLYEDNFFDELIKIMYGPQELLFFIFLVFPLRILYWIYEVFHTFFVLTVQFSAFFTIIFWLFLLFYTFFVYEKYEHHFNNLNKIHNILINDLKNLKK